VGKRDRSRLEQPSQGGCLKIYYSAGVRYRFAPRTEIAGGHCEPEAKQSRVFVFRVLPKIVWVLGRTSVGPKGIPSFVRRGGGEVEKGRKLNGAHTKA
jgi:hypothetical protein